MQSTGTADVLVVGLGAFGSAALYQAARRGAKVIGIDQFSPPHDRGSSHGETRITRLAVGEGSNYVPLIRRSNEIWDALQAETGARLVERVGGLFLGGTDGTMLHHGKPDFIRRCIEVAQHWQIEHEVLNAQEITQRFPQFLTRGDEMAYYEPSAGVLFPAQCVRVQLELARRNGADIRVNEKVLSIEETGDTVTVRTSAGQYSAAKVIVSAGAWIPGLDAGAAAGHLQVMHQVLHWFEVDEPALFAPQRSPVFIWIHGSGDEEYMYGFPMIDGVAGVKVATEQFHKTTDPDALDRVVRPEEIQRMYERHVGGRLKSVQPRSVNTAVCMYTVSTDSDFIIDRLRDMQHVSIVSACSGHGFKNSAGLGESMARAALGEATPELTPFALDRLR